MKVRQGFHRLGMVVLVPLAVVAGCCFLFAAYLFQTGGREAEYFGGIGLLSLAYGGFLVGPLLGDRLGYRRISE
jgi:hypothetical protein